MTDRLLHNAARAMFVSAKFTNVPLSNMKLENLTQDWPNSEYVEWRSLSDEEREQWYGRARQWMSTLQENRPHLYKVLIDGYKDLGD